MSSNVFVSSPCQALPCNTTGKDYFVGDIHGHFEALEEKLKQIGFNPERDRLFSVGDLVDRGPNSEAVLEWLERPYFYAVRGNHDDMCIRAATGNMQQDRHVKNGGAWIVFKEKQVQLAYQAALLKLPLMLEIAQSDGSLIGLVHAEVMDLDWHKTKSYLISSAAKERKAARETLLWGRSKINQKDTTSVTGVTYVVVGHSIVEAPLKLGNVLYIDTGKCYGGSLTVMDYLTVKTMIES